MLVTLYVRVWIETSYHSHTARQGCVTLYVRVWIETHMVIWQLWKLQSPSTWGCGLKPKISLPVFLSLCHPLREGVDWNLPLRPYVLNLSCHPLREGVDWNQLNHNFKEPFSSHPLREGVDWNKGINEQLKAYDVTLYVRVWIETIPSATFWKHVVSPSTWGCGLKQFYLC